MYHNNVYIVNDYKIMTLKKKQLHSLNVECPIKPRSIYSKIGCWTLGIINHKSVFRLEVNKILMTLSTSVSIFDYYTIIEKKNIKINNFTQVSTIF